MSTTNIEWCDRVWNPVTGCTKVSPGCKHCYAEGVAHRFWHHQYVHIAARGFIPVKAYAGEPMTGTLRRFTDVMTHADRLLEPLSWRKPAKVFVNSMSDLFHESVPFEFIAAVFGVMAATPQHTYQILTKRPARMIEWFAWLRHECRHRSDFTLAAWQVVEDEARELVEDAAFFDGQFPATATGAPWPLPNVWLGVSVEDQQRADERIPLLLQVPAAVRFVSAEPLLGPVDFLSIPRSGKHHDYLTGEYQCSDLEKRTTARLDWVIVGGESGPGARPCDIESIRSIVRQCQASRTAVFVKQFGSNPIWRLGNGWPANSGSNPAESRRAAGVLDRNGGDPAEWPDDLRVREFPR